VLGTGRHTWYPLSSSLIIDIDIICMSTFDVVGTISGAPPACIQMEKLEIKVCGRQARTPTVKDGSKLSELSSAASSISICCCENALVQSRAARVNVTHTYLRHCVLRVFWKSGFEKWDGYAGACGEAGVCGVRQYNGISNDGSFCMWGSVGFGRR